MDQPKIDRDTLDTRLSRLAALPVVASRFGHPRFYTLLDELAALHSSKNQDYGQGDDPLANFKMANACGIEPWLGALIRMGDKLARLQTYARTRKLNHEGVVDTLKDLAVYSLLCIVLFEEAQGWSGAASPAAS